MSYFIFQTLLRDVQDLHITDERLYQSILEMPFDGLVIAYNALTRFLMSVWNVRTFRSLRSSFPIL